MIRIALLDGNQEALNEVVDDIAHVLGYSQVNWHIMREIGKLIEQDLTPKENQEQNI